MRIPASFFMGTLLVIVSTSIVQADPLNGAALYTQYQCHVCHGEHGEHPARGGYPVIAGQDRIYLVQQIKDIRDGVRDNAQTDLMRPMVKSISDVEAAAVAEYLSVQ